MREMCERGCGVAAANNCSPKVVSRHHSNKRPERNGDFDATNGEICDETGRCCGAANPRSAARTKVMSQVAPGNFAQVCTIVVSTGHLNPGTCCSGPLLVAPSKDETLVKNLWYN